MDESIWTRRRQAPTCWSSPWTAWNLLHIVKLLLAVTAANSKAWSSWRCRRPRVSTSKGGERKYSQKNTRYIQIQNDSNRKEYYKGFGPVSLIPRWPFSCCNMAQSPVDASSLFLAGRCDCLRIQPRTTGLLRRHDCTGISLYLCVPIMRTSLT